MGNKTLTSQSFSDQLNFPSALFCLKERTFEIIPLLVRLLWYRTDYYSQLLVREASTRNKSQILKGFWPQMTIPDILILSANEHSSTPNFDMILIMKKKAEEDLNSVTKKIPWLITVDDRIRRQKGGFYTVVKMVNETKQILVVGSCKENLRCILLYCTTTREHTVFSLSQAVSNMVSKHSPREMNRLKKKMRGWNG
jgi:hypothetical protein